MATRATVTAAELAGDVVAGMGVASVQARFVIRDNTPERLACEAEIHFHGGVLDGMKLVGFSIWRSPEGELYVTFPSRAFGTGNERRFFDFLRSVEGNSSGAKRIKAWILDSYREWREGGD